METWLPVVDYEGLYEISDCGQVRSLPRQTRTGVRGGKTLALPPDSHGRPHVTLHKGGIQKIFTVHRLVMDAFAGPLPPAMETRHLDGDPTNNHWPSNLIYGTRGENQQDAVQHGTHRETRKTHCPAKHPLSGSNLYVDPQGNRHCRICRREQWQAWRDRKRAKAAHCTQDTMSPLEDASH